MNNSKSKKWLYVLVVCLLAISGFIFYGKAYKKTSPGQLNNLTEVIPGSKTTDSYSESKKLSTSTDREVEQTTRLVKIPGQVVDNFKTYENYLRNNGYIVQVNQSYESKTIIAQKGRESFVMVFTVDKNDPGATVANISHLDVAGK